MKRVNKNIGKPIILALFLCLHLTSNAQFGYGFTVVNDIYHRYSNPEDGIASRGAGSALLNLGAGPKIWIGGEKMSFSAEAQATIGILGFAIKDFKGMGTASFPIMAKLNFNGVSGFNKEGRPGLSIGAGIQYSKTELYGLSNDYESRGVKRDFFKTYIVQVGYGFGLSGFGINGFGRYGWNKDIKASMWSIGLQWDFNLPALKNIRNPNSTL